MRDLLSKLDAIVSETELKNPKNLQDKLNALADLEKDPVASSDPEISSAITQKKSDLEREAKSKDVEESFQIGDAFGISFSEDFEIGTEIVGFLEDGIVVELDDSALEMLTNEGLIFLEGEVVTEEKIKGVDGKACWKGKRYAGKVKKADGTYKDKCVPVGEDLDEYFQFEFPKGKDRGPRDHGHDELARRERTMGKGGLAKDARDYKEKDKYGDAYKIKGPKGKLPEDHGPEDPNAAVNYGEYDREGDMAKDDLRTIDDAAEELYSILRADDNLPEWVQSKITKAMDYIDTARDYMKAQNYEEGMAEGDYPDGSSVKTPDSSEWQQQYQQAVDKVNNAKTRQEYEAASERAGKIKDFLASKGIKVGPILGKGMAEGDVDEAKYQGREVPLGKKMAGDVKKSKVYVRKPNGNIVKVNFGDKKMRIKKSNPARRKSFRARHNCANPGPRHKARYWSCRSW
jgi:hypothetical protein